MNCEKCGNSLSLNAKFCGKCGEPVKTLLHENLPVHQSKITTIKCGNCGYLGKPESNRSLIAKILAWLCILGAPIITILYFATTKKYRCPTCKSAFVGIKDKNGNFVDQKRSILRIIVIIFVCIFVIGVLSSVFLAALGTAREKARQQQSSEDWTTYNAVSDGFSILVPHSPNFESTSDSTTDGTGYEYHSYSVGKGSEDFLIVRYIYSEPIDVSSPDNFLEKLMNGFVSGSESKLTNSSYTDYKSYRALDFSSQTTSENIRGRILLVRETPYLLIMSHPRNINTDVDYNKFINSFEVK